jgi:bifunctional enzyme CysN/CysC
MAQRPDHIGADIRTFLDTEERTSLLRFMTCGSVDDGKSTLIGRLLYESKLIFEDQLAAVTADSKKVGTQGGELDLALLVDGLAAEREQGITIDVAYRFFATARRKFIVADAPGHEQYTRNMVTAASNVDAAVVLIDARKGVLTQTRRHSYILSLLGIRHVALAVNKMDTVGWAQSTFDAIVAEYRDFARSIDLTDVTAIPLSALKGDNVTSASVNMPWHGGPTLMAYLEALALEVTLEQGPLRLPVQWVNRPHQDFRGYTGLLVSGSVRTGDRIRVLPSGKESQVARILGPGGDLELAVAGQSVTLTLADEIDVSRGDVIAAAQAPPAIADQFQTTLIWMHEEPMLPGRPYLVKIGTRTVTASITSPKYKINVNTLEHLAAKQLELNEIGVCNLSFDEPVAFDPYAENRDTGGFVLIDRVSNDTLGAGLIQYALRRADNIHWQALDVNKTARARLKGQRSCILWFTGLSGAGKSTIANLIDRRLYALGRHTYILDGDNVRHGLNKDLGFTDADRVENIRRVAEVSRLMMDAGLIVLVSFISPFRAERRMARELVGAGEFFEVFVDTPLAAAEQRDAKGLYAKARRGELKNFTGIDSPYEAPERPEIHIDTTRVSAEQAAQSILAALRTAGILQPATDDNWSL